MVKLDKIVEEIQDAELRIRKCIRKTPLEYSRILSTGGRNKTYLKLENIQHTGSFKFRGAINKVMSLSDIERSQGIITASTGNHGMATAYALEITNGKGTIYLPKNVLQAKLQKLQQFNVPIEFYGFDSEETESQARIIAAEKNKIFISPYNDPKIIGGQGTIGVEILEQLEKVDHVFVTVGGGGLISGIAAWLKSKYPKIIVHGCLPQNSPVMSDSVKAGEIVSMPIKDTLSDGSAGGIEAGAITFPLCQQLVDEYILVTEDEIKKAIKLVFEHHRLIIEGAAGVAVSSYLKSKERVEGNVVIIICGGNIDTVKFLEIVSSG
ncbi:MAG: threonine/serine dehydratase [Candidatus Kariarchaeaceae archaeon]|jgi:threonine dehydratase